jgi:hypothetical protein
MMMTSNNTPTPTAFSYTSQFSESFSYWDSEKDTENCSSIVTPDHKIETETADNLLWTPWASSSPTLISFAREEGASNTYAEDTPCSDELRDVSCAWYDDDNEPRMAVSDDVSCAASTPTSSEAARTMNDGSYYGYSFSTYDYALQLPSDEAAGEAVFNERARPSSKHCRRNVQSSQ